MAGVEFGKAKGFLCSSRFHCKGEIVSSRINTIRLYAVAALILIIVGSVIMYYSFSFSTSTAGPSSASQSSSDSSPVSVVSPQWAGYVAMSNLILRESEVTGVAGSWMVPSVEPTVNNVYSSVWVGVGGYGENSLIQVGTAQQSVKGVASYYAWYETLPNLAVRLVNFTVKPGDEIAASVKLVDKNQNSWTIEITDLTSGANFSRSFVYRSSRLSAEWVVEAPSIRGNVTSLADFGSVAFTGCFATIANSTGPVSSFPGYQIVMHDSQDVQIADVSGLNAEGSGFTVNYSKPIIANNGS